MARRALYDAKILALAFGATAMLGCAGGGRDRDTGDGDDTEEDALIRLAHLAADAPDVDVFVDEVDAPVVTDLSFGEGTDFLTLQAGSYQFDVAPAGASLAESILTVASLDLSPDRAYTAAVIGTVADLRAIVIPETGTAAPPGDVRIRAIHAAPAVGPVDIWNMTSMPPAPLFESLGYADVGSELEIPAGTYVLGIDVNDDAMPDLLYSLPSLIDGDVVNVYAVSDTPGNVFLMVQSGPGMFERIDPS